jgi:transcriptional regulator
MLIRDVDCDEDPDRWRAFLVDQGFGHFVAGGAGRAIPVVVPTQYVVTEAEIVFHLIATNPIFEALEENPRAIMSVAGDWAFIPGAWKAIGDEDPARGIPTTYYAAVQVTGTCTIQSAPDEVAGVLATQLGLLDPHGVYVDPSEHRARLGAIRGIRLTIEDVRAKYKYGGNVDVAHRNAVAEHLAERNGPGDAAALAHLRRTR